MASDDDQAPSINPDKIRSDDAAVSKVVNDFKAKSSATPLPFDVKEYLNAPSTGKPSDTDKSTAPAYSWYESRPPPGARLAPGIKPDDPQWVRDLTTPDIPTIPSGPRGIERGLIDLGAFGGDLYHLARQHILAVNQQRAKEQAARQERWGRPTASRQTLADQRAPPSALGDLARRVDEAVGPGSTLQRIAATPSSGWTESTLRLTGIPASIGSTALSEAVPATRAMREGVQRFMRNPVTEAGTESRIAAVNARASGPLANQINKTDISQAKGLLARFETQIGADKAARKELAAVEDIIDHHYSLGKSGTLGADEFSRLITDLDRKSLAMRKQGELQPNMRIVADGIDEIVGRLENFASRGDPEIQAAQQMARRDRERLVEQILGPTPDPRRTNWRILPELARMAWHLRHTIGSP